MNLENILKSYKLDILSLEETIKLINDLNGIDENISIKEKPYIPKDDDFDGIMSKHFNQDQ